MTPALVCPRGRDHQLDAIVGVMERAFCHECGEMVALVADVIHGRELARVEIASVSLVAEDQLVDPACRIRPSEFEGQAMERVAEHERALRERIIRAGGLVMPPKPAPINPERLRTRGFYVEEVLRRGAIVEWVGIRAPDGTPLPYSPDVARELLLSMPDADFGTFLRACGMEMHALSFAVARGMGDLARAAADFGVSAMQAAASVQRMSGMLSLLNALEHRDPTWQWLHHHDRRRRARAKYGQGRPRRINGRLRPLTREEKRKARSRRFWGTLPAKLDALDQVRSS